MQIRELRIASAPEAAFEAKERKNPGGTLLTPIKEAAVTCVRPPSKILARSQVGLVHRALLIETNTGHVYNIANFITVPFTQRMYRDDPSSSFLNEKYKLHL